jgi:hypothetical protein
MTAPSLRGRGRVSLRLVLAALPLVCLSRPAPLRAQEWAPGGDDRPALGLPDLTAWSVAGTTPAVPARNNRIRLFRFQPGFIAEPLGLQDDDPQPEPGSLPPSADNGPDWLSVAMGNDNPYFEFRQPGDPGGLGFYRVDTQVQLFDTGKTGCALHLRTVTPAGVQFNGLPDGPTVVSPSLGVFHSLDDGTALQGFVGKNMPLLHADWQVPIRRTVQYGMAVQRPLAAGGQDELRNVYLSVGALGQAQIDGGSLRPAPLGVLPGMHWHVSDSCWMSGGVMLPVGPSSVINSSSPQWQFTCSFQF